MTMIFVKETDTVQKLFSSAEFLGGINDRFEDLIGTSLDNTPGRRFVDHFLLYFGGADLSTYLDGTLNVGVTNLTQSSVLSLYLKNPPRSS